MNLAACTLPQRPSCSLRGAAFCPSQSRAEPPGRAWEGVAGRARGATAARPPALHAPRPQPWWMPSVSPRPRQLSGAPTLALWGFVLFSLPGEPLCAPEALSQLLSSGIPLTLQILSLEIPSSSTPPLPQSSAQGCFSSVGLRALSLPSVALDTRGQSVYFHPPGL